jgi:CRISPR-associated protein Cas4
MKDQLRHFIYDTLYDLVQLDREIILLAMLIVVTIIVLDSVTLVASRKRKQSGIDKKMTAVGIEGNRTLPVRNYVSDIQGLAGRPDAVIVENGFPIPVERKPLAKKLRDRYVAQILVYMRVIEEFEMKKPPYGYLLLGPNSRRVKVHNSEEKQRWLQRMLDEMNDILQGKIKAVPTPEARKCSRCPVRDHCELRGDLAPGSRRSITIIQQK